MAEYNQAKTASAEAIKNGKAYLGIEFGSTRIKASLIDSAGTPLADGSYGWENQNIDGIWTYDLDDVWAGAKGCFSDLAADVQKQYGVSFTRVAGLGISGMMHGYLVFDKQGKLLVPFRTWRNNINGQACGELSPLFDFAIPQRWSVAHLYQAILNGEDHVGSIGFITTLAGYVHWKLSGEKVIGRSAMHPECFPLTRILWIMTILWLKVLIPVCQYMHIPGRCGISSPGYLLPETPPVH